MADDKVKTKKGRALKSAFSNVEYWLCNINFNANLPGNFKNLKCFCEDCVKLLDGFRCLIQPVIAKNDISDEIRSDIKKILKSHGRALSKRGIDSVSNDLKYVQRFLDVANDNKDQENNIAIFHLAETDGKDKNTVLSVVNKLTGDSIKANNILKIYGQGRRVARADTPRPVIVKFFSLVVKMKSTELRGLIADAKFKEAGNQHFLYRVRGVAGRWKIVKLP
ncbi:hypothetical protein HELRODRAFT_167896 [Helobdella robusta]|uniref:Uncharacterized protein n=1 Tax=Helobdella robusta TaxID=6412 RepID=T1EZX7_HELRO|nr:hypothetical protein HELRODRAFT_167896 [Helobdella robusta]ESO10052.1 hypothetical protein HELRODRAFT_167896 [Helobdella robusta]